MRISPFALAFLLLGPTHVLAQEPCQLRGVWELVSAKYDEHVPSGTWRQIKIFTATHFAFLGSADRGVKDMKTAADSLQAFRTMSAGGGAYTQQDTMFTEKLEYFDDPAYLGMSLTYSCKTVGDRFTQTGNYPILQDGRKVRDLKLEEVYRRIE